VHDGLIESLVALRQFHPTFVLPATHSGFGPTLGQTVLEKEPAS
jgi:hypothetical protein